MYVFALKLNWFPSYGLTSVKHYVLPVIAATICELSAYLRFTKSSMLESIRQDYVRTARAKGVAEGAAARGYFDWYAFRLLAGRHGYHGKIVLHPGYWFSNR